MKKDINMAEAISKIRDGSTILVGGFMTVGTPEKIIDALVKSNVKELTLVCNDAGYENKGIGKLIANNQVKKLITSHIGLNPQAGILMSAGELIVELVPQGTLAERIRAHGVGLGGILTETGVGTIVEEGKELIQQNGKTYILEKPLKGDFALLSAELCDEIGNLTYSKTTRNFNPIMATSADVVMVYPKKCVKRGTLDPELIITPHIFVDHIITEEEACQL
jgi:acetate CoA/acetoacetate CoA-transferase alpha subunit